MPVNNPEAYGKGQEKQEFEESYYQPYPVVQPVSQMKFDSYDKLQSGAYGKPAPSVLKISVLSAGTLPEVRPSQ